MARYYNTYRMTPAERRARAQRIVQYREERSMLNKYLQEKEEADKLMREQEAARLSAENKEKERREVGFLGRGLSTVGDLLANVGTGAVKGVEGIADLGLGLVGGIGGIFDDDFEDKVKDIIAKDWTGTYIGEPLQEALRYSYLKDGGIIENVASGVGQMLPAVAVTIATGGAGAGTLAATVAEMASLGVTMAGAAGNATEEAFKEGADYWRGLGYGVASGAVEGATERLLGGATSKIFGAGMLDGVVRSVAGEVAETGVRRVVKDAAGEAFEEGLAELVNPALKSIYKGRDAFSEYGEADYWKGVGESALVGGLTSVAFGGTVGRAMKTSGKYADISGSLEANDNIAKERRSLEKRDRLSPEAEASSIRAERQNLLNIEKALKRSNETQRQELFDRFKLDSSFESDGSIKESVIKRLEAMEKGDGRYRKEYYSVGMRGNEAMIEEDLKAISERTGVEAKVFDRELSETGKKNFTKTKKALAALNDSGGNNVSFVITEANEAYKGGLVDDKVIYIPADQLESDDWAGTLVHEFTHFEEGTDEYNEMFRFLQSDEILVDDGAGGKMKLWESARDAVLAKGYVADVDQLDAVIGKANAKGVKALSKSEYAVYTKYTTELAAHETEMIMGNEGFIDHIIRTDEANGIVKRILMLDRALSGMKDKQARAQAKLIKQAERLYLRAAENSGNAYIKKMILAQDPELEDELTRINAEKMQVKVQYDLKYSDAIDLLDKGELNRTQNTHLKLLDHTPQLYIDKANAKDLKIVMAWDIAYLAMNQNGDIPGNYHSLGPDIMKAIPDAIKDPLYIIKQENGRIIAVTEIVVKGNRSTIASIELDTFKSTTQDGQSESDNYNLIVTIMDAKPNYLQNTIFGGKIVYNKNNEDPADFILRLKSLKKALSNDDPARSSNNSISHSAEKSTENAKKVFGGAGFDLELSTPADQMRLMNKIIGEKNIRFNLKAVEQHKAKLNEQFSKDAAVDLDTVMKRYDKIISIWTELGGELNSKFLNEWDSKVGKDRVFTVFKAQAGYKYNVELSSMCKKGVPLFEAIDTIVKQRVMEELDTDVIGKEEKEILYDILKNHSFEIPCAICYVEQARQREGAIIDAFLNGKAEKNSKGEATAYKCGWNWVLDAIEQEMKKSGVDYTFKSLSRSAATDTYSPEDLSMDSDTQDAFYSALKKVANEEISRYNKAEGKNRKLVTSITPAAIKDVFKGTLPSNLKIFKVLFTEPSSRFKIESDLLYSSMTTYNLANHHHALYSLFNSQGGVSGYKTKQGSVVYWGDILGKKWVPSKVRNEGGIRNQSNSDFQIYTLLDQVQMYIDFTAKGYYLQAYTKVLSELKLFGLSRGKINASLIPSVFEYRNADGTVDVEKTRENAGLDQDGELIFDDFEGINHLEAFMLLEDPEYSRSIGGTCIGYSDKHIRKLLDDGRIQQVIGFHDKTDDPTKRYRGAKYAKNYNGLNEAINKDGKTVHIGFNPYVKKAEKMFKFDAESESYSGKIEHNGKTYTPDDIPKLAADLYLEMCESRGYTPAYADFTSHQNYYKLLADFSLYDSEGHYAPHRKVAYEMPDKVPYLDPDGKKKYTSTQEYIKAELQKELGVRDAISEALADESENGIIPEFKRRVNEAARKKRIQFNLKEDYDLGDFFADDNDGGPVYKVSGGQVRKVIADNTRMKVYTRAESEQIVNQIVSEKLSFGELYGTIGGKSKNEVVDMLWSGLNSADIGERGKVALDVADYIINNAAVESIYDGEGLEVYRDTVAALKPYLHKMELASIKGDIKHRYDKDSSPYLLWGKRKGEVGLSPEQVAAELSEAGFKIEAESPADIFIEIHDAYKNASAKLKKEAKSALNIGLTAEEQKNLKQSIAREVLAAFDKGGSPSKLSAIVNKYIKQSNTWREKYNAEKQRNAAISDTLYKVKKLKDLKTDAFLNASEHKPHLFKGSIEKLAAIETRGHINKAGTRRIVSELAEWYVRDNPMLKENNLFDEEVEGMLYVISHGKGQLSTDEISMLGDIVSYFAKFVENYNKVYRNGKYEDAKPIAERYIKTMVENGKINVGFINKITGSKYLRIFGDPMTVMRRMDLYESGFYTEMMEQLREGAIGASVMEMDIREPLEKFFEKNKKFLQEIREHKIKYEGFEMTSAQAMLYYMTLNRKQALAGLAKSGFAYIDDNDKTVRVPGFLKTEGMDQATLEQVFQLENLTPAAKAEQAKIYDQLTAAEKQYISIAEKIFNDDCKNAKREMDMRRKGFSNALEDYYVPIRRGNIAKSVDAGTFFDEMNRASNASFNKDTVRGAKNELFIESLDSVLDRHIRGVSQYANLATVIDAYDTIFNLAVNDDPNKPESVRTVSENVWREGAEYFKNVISDIQGIPAESRREGYQLIKQLRSGYAKYQLGANPKVWFTQLSSFCAATSILDVDSITQGFGIDAKDVDEWCALAKLRNSENTVAAAQGLFDEHSKPGKVLEATGKFGDVLMTPIGWVDRFVVTKLFGACQVQVAKNGGAKVGTKANKQAAGELLQKVILETQQNATATDRSAAMRSGNELMKTITMFTADSMKVMGRVIDSVGEVSVLKARLKTATAEERTKLETRLKAAEKQARRSIASLVSSAAFMAVIAQLFRTLYNKDDEDDNIALNMAVDAAGNMIGGLPGIKDVYGFFADGYGLDNYAYSAINDLFESARDIMDVGGSAFSGDLEGRELASSIKKMTYAAGQVLGLPTRNAYNVVYGLTKRVSPSTAYKIDDAFYNQSYRADLTRAIERGDDKMIATIAGLMLNENVGGIEDPKSRQELDRLITAGFDIIPRATASSITYDGEEYVLDASDRKDFEKIYTVGNEVLADLVKMSKYQSASDEVKAAAISYIYKVYWDLAVQEIVGEDLETKTVLFAEAIDIEKLALIVATASTLKADTDKSGKAVSGSRKKKIQEYVNSLDLKAVEKYMIMGYLGYKNVKGEAQVKAYINKLKLTKSEREKLIVYSGY